MSGYRPRGALSRAILQKFQSDAMLENADLIHSWYRMNREIASQYQCKFINFSPDPITLQWLEDSKRQSSRLWLQIWFIFAKFFLSLFMNQTDINGFLSRGSMFILSEDQIAKLLNNAGFSPPTNRPMRILDIGAGDGHCTVRIQTALQNQYGTVPEMMVTETSWIMRKRLQEFKNFRLVEVADVKHLQELDLVSCLNVLDRCSDPHQMLSDIYNILGPNGRAIFALVLPYYHYVESNTSHLPVKPLFAHWSSNSSTGPSSTCDCHGDCEYSSGQPRFDEEVRIFFDSLTAKGFRVESWTKAPYLCEGDIKQSFYFLIDIVVVVSKV